MPSFEQGRESLDVPVTPKTTNTSHDGTESTVATPQQSISAVPVGAIASATPGGPSAATTTGPAAEEARTRIEKILQSDIGVNTLLIRLKQSISSVKDFSSFLKERANLEEKHAHGLKKLARGTNELIRRPDNRQGSFASSYEEITRIQDRMADNGMEFAQEVQLMADQLRELAADTEQGRKHWKHVGLDAEARAQEAEATMDKAKARYFQLAEQYDRARTGEKQGGKFGLKGPKSAQQQEEALLGKVETADGDYSAKVQAAQAQRHELLTSSRPHAVREMQALINQCDAGLSSHMAKFAMLSEKLLLHNGLSVSPLKTLPNGAPSNANSLRDLVGKIGNQSDFDQYVLSHSNAIAGPPRPDIKYEKHPALQPTTQQPMMQQPNYGPINPPTGPSAPFAAHPPSRSDTGQTSLGTPTSQPFPVSGPPQSQNSGPYQANQPQNRLPAQPPQIGALSMGGRTSGDSIPPGMQKPGGDYRNFSGPPQHRPNQPSQSDQPPGHYRYASGPQPPYDGYGPGPGRGQPPPAQYQNGPPPQGPYGGPPQPGPGGYGAHGQRPSFGQPPDFRQDPRGGPNQPQPQPYPNPDTRGLPSQNGGNRPPNGPNGNTYGYNPTPAPGPANMTKNTASLPPIRPVFGVSLDELFRRDGTAVPAIVYQCVQAIDMYGLNVEGIYRTSGSTQHITELRALFDHDSSQVDFRDASSFHNDIAAVTTLFKCFLRELKDPLLTSANYNDFIRAAKVDDDVVRRDSLHQIINSLPDPNYATLRTIVLHLNRVASHSAQNRMTASNLAIVFGPTLMGANGSGPSGEIQDSGWQARVIETILSNTLQIFDDDE